jgi:hypothetical protein
MGLAHKTVKEALEYVARHPEPSRPPIEMPTWELVARQLFQAANTIGGNGVTMKRSVGAQKIIFDRLAGKRKAGTHPAVPRTKRKLEVLDLTQFGAGNE